MKLIIKESKRDVLAKKQLSKLFSELDIDEDDYKDSTGVHKRLSFSDDSGVVMIWGDTEALYVCTEIIDELQIFTFSTDKLKKVIGDWIYETFELPVSIVQIVNKTLLN
jgi:hypothetical protein